MRLRLVGGLDVSADTTDCMYLDVGMCREMDSTTTHEITAMTSQDYSDLKNV